MHINPDFRPGSEHQRSRSPDPRSRSPKPRRHPGATSRDPRVALQKAEDVLRRGGLDPRKRAELEQTVRRCVRACWVQAKATGCAQR